jgi:protein-L-isoaspartate O-methyltransferase
VAATPRHVLVPRFHIQDAVGWRTVEAPQPGWLDAVYRDAPLITALLPGSDGRDTVVSSSTKPGLMVRMLDALDLHDGQTVLEIGTGTGYNAALLCHRLGDDHVFSVDIGAEMVDAARDRLASIGHHPVLRAGDGSAGLPGLAPFDHIIATCSVPAVPPAWGAQLRDGGTVLVDLKIGLHAGSLVLLQRHGDTLEGRFLPRWAGFMPVRSTDTAPLPAPPADRSGTVSEAFTQIDPDPWAALVPWFLAQIGQPPITGYGRRGPDLSTTVISAADGSWCEIGETRPDGRRVARSGGPRTLWADIEHGHAEWARLDRPGWDRLGLTITPNGDQLLWCDSPNHVVKTVSTHDQAVPGL